MPLRTLAMRARLSPELLDVETARADLGGRINGGTVSLGGAIHLQQLSRSTLQAQLLQVDLRALMTALPRTAFAGTISVEPRQDDIAQLQADIRNSLPGPLDGNRAPVNRLLASLSLAPSQWRIDTMEAQVAEGRVLLQGQYSPGTKSLALARRTATPAAATDASQDGQ